MNLRGPITKLDIVSTRLKIMHIMRLTMDICRKIGIPIDDYTIRTSDAGRIPGGLRADPTRL